MLFGLLKEPESWKPCRPVLAILRPYSSWSHLQSCSTEVSFARFHLLTINISSCECSLKVNSYAKFSRLTPKLAWLLHALQCFASLPSIGFAPNFLSLLRHYVHGYSTTSPKHPGIQRTFFSCSLSQPIWETKTSLIPISPVFA